jgi:hypothetical protein
LITSGYIRCSQLVTRALSGDGHGSSQVPIDIVPEKKKAKILTTIKPAAINIAAASSSNGVSSFRGGNINAEGNVEDKKAIVSDSDDEFICSIRPADSPSPHSRGSLISTSLSPASIVSDDLDTNISNN